MQFNIDTIAASDVKVGQYIFVDNKACQVTLISVAKTGKHGHMKVNISATEITTNKKYPLMCPGTFVVKTFKPIKNNYQVIFLDKSNQTLECLDSNNREKTFDLARYTETKVGYEYLTMIKGHIADDKIGTVSVTHVPIATRTDDYNNDYIFTAFVIQ